MNKNNNNIDELQRKNSPKGYIYFDSNNNNLKN